MKRTFAVHEIYITAGLMYLAATYGILLIFKKTEHLLFRHLHG